MEDYTFDAGPDDVGEEFPDLKAGGPNLCELVKLEFRERKDGSDIYLNAEITVVDVQDDDLEGNVKRKHWEIFNLGSKSLWKLKSFLSSMAQEDEPLWVKGEKLDTSKWEGRFFVCDFKTEKFNGNTNLRMRNYKKAAGWDGHNYRVDEDGVLEEHDAVDASSLAGKAAKPNGASGDSVEI